MGKYILMMCVLLVTVTACHKPKELSPGIYASSHYSSTDKVRMALLYNVTKVASDSDLILNPDFTFVYTECGKIYKGNWIQTNDTLLLNVKKVRWKLSEYERAQHTPQPQLPVTPIVFHISGNMLEQIHGNWVKVLEYQVERSNMNLL